MARCLAWAALMLGSGALAGAAHAQAVCNVGATGLAFGLYTMTKPSPTTTVGTITVSCSAPTATTVSYTLALSGGAPMDLRSRSMALGGRPLPYQLFLDPALTQIWGDGGEGTNVASVSNIPLSPGVTDRRSFLVYGRIAGRYPAASGIYQDNVTIVLNY